MSVQSYRDLKVWQKAMELVTESYQLARLLPSSENYGLISQLQRAAASIPANIAEGHGRQHLGDYLHHLSIANGSLMELETHMLIAERLEFLRRDQIATAMEKAAELGRMLAGLRKGLVNMRRSNDSHDT